MRKVTVKYKCDGRFCSYSVDPTAKYYTPVIGSDINTGDIKEISVYAWTDHLAEQNDALHFHDDTCAKEYLVHWLETQKPKPEVATETPQVARKELLNVDGHLTPTGERLQP